ncbi:hypothetical protein POM88_026571 [Heracleum sosnowskyi]|uniref:Uncharacterized protein n=1 Tax=Heracleum sosnowskyi TaxID=360622 RepID=A0AAD8I8E7_9APIA|nr:hypothetical protein POM88_026565 [Heracleum sosnowskyi]KAK1379827.1 hypothetical protein POM88_026571 [Heracleum sosnowskyi]
MSLYSLNLLVILGVVVLTAPSLAIRYPNQMASPKYKLPEYEFLFHNPPILPIPKHPETLKKPIRWNPIPPNPARPVYPGFIKPPPPPSDLVYPGYIKTPPPSDSSRKTWIENVHKP